MKDKVRPAERLQSRVLSTLLPSLLTGLCLASAIGPAGAEAPLSAIDWLSDSVTSPETQPKPNLPEAPLNAIPSLLPEAGKGGSVDAGNGSVGNNLPVGNETGVSKGGQLPDPVVVTVLGGPSLDAMGLLPASVTGFPRALWGAGKTDTIAASLQDLHLESLPSLQALFMTMLLAEADAPADSRAEGSLLIARIDKLLEIGALEQAQALIEVAGAGETAALFRRAFDVALLLGEESRACDVMRDSPNLAPTLTARVFCLARAGDWTAAALTLQTAKALGLVSELEEQLLARFLDPDLFDGEPVPAPPKPVTPLIWHVYAAIGEPLSTFNLPYAFAHAELSDRSGWKAQIEAAERLARVGAITPNVLLGLYTEREPAASGGVWDRADAFQRLDQALVAGDAAAVEQRLPVAFARMRDVEIEAAFASLFAQPLSKLPLQGDAQRIAYELGLLSPDYERLANSPLMPKDARSLFMAGLARGDVAATPAPDSMGRAIALGFAAPPLPDDIALLIDEARIGEAIFAAMARIDHGVTGDLVKVTEGLATLRKLGLEDVARRTALELMILERRG